MPELFSTPSIVLAGKDLGESDRLITFYTLHGGKMRGVAKGAKRSRRRFVNALEPCTLLDLTLALSRTGGLSRVEAADIQETFPAIRESTACYLHASLSSELMDLWTKESDPQKDLFDLFLWYLRNLAGTRPPEKHTLIFKTRLLSLVGYQPDFEHCRKCGKNANRSGVVYQISSGGFLCKGCSMPSQTSAHSVLPGTLRTLTFIQSKALKDLGRLTIGAGIFDEAWDLVRSLHCHHLQRKPASYTVLAANKNKAGTQG